MTKDERMDSFKYSVLQHAYKHKNIILPLPVKRLTHPEPSIMSG